MPQRAVHSLERDLMLTKGTPRVPVRENERALEFRHRHGDPASWSAEEIVVYLDLAMQLPGMSQSTQRPPSLAELSRQVDQLAQEVNEHAKRLRRK